MLIIFQLNVGRLTPGQELNAEQVINAFNEGKAYFVAIHIKP
jgi:hypothetical protein